MASSDKLFACRLLQDEELSELLELFPGQVKDLRTQSASGEPLEVLLTVFPYAENSEEASKRIVLRVRCPKDYPEDAPDITIERSDGVTVEKEAKLRRELSDIAKENPGRNILLDIMLLTRTFLEKIERKKKDEEIREGVLDMLSATQSFGLVVAQSGETECSDSGILPYHDYTICKDSCKYTVGKTLVFSCEPDRKILCGKCTNHSERGYVVYHGMDIERGVPVVLIKWTFQRNEMRSRRSGVKTDEEIVSKLQAEVQQEFDGLKKLKHPNIVPYMGITFDAQKESLAVYVIQEYANGCSLDSIFGGVAVSDEQLRTYIKDIMLAMQYLHENSVAHGSISEKSIFKCSDGLKLADFSLVLKMTELKRRLQSGKYGDSLLRVTGSCDMKSDILSFGKMLISLSTGHLFTMEEIPHRVSPGLRDFLEKCLADDESERWTPDELLNHFFLLSSPLQTFPKSLKEKEAIKAEERVSSAEPEFRRQESRFSTEFEVLEEIGSGSFGKVLSVRNKLDSRMYAIKVIPLSAADEKYDRDIKQEVKLLSRLNHENIVRYYNSWTEDLLPKGEPFSGNVQNLPFEIFVPYADQTSIDYTSSDYDDDYDDEWDDYDDGDDSNDIVYNDDLPHFRRDCRSSVGIEYQPEAVGYNSLPDFGEESSIITDEESVTKQFQKMMCIQMELCEKLTLRTAIEVGLNQRVPRVWRLFREIVEGLKYIHKQGIIHRDLKPDNIFLDKADSVKIGDFGLAKAVTPRNVNSPPSESQPISFGRIHPSFSVVSANHQLSEAGTPLYMAPEMTKHSYSEKVDIYSLGIIFFEMCFPPPLTTMERFKLIENLRKPDIILPSEVSTYLSPDTIEILKWLLQHDDNKRPTAAEIIESKLMPRLPAEEATFRSMVSKAVSNPESKNYGYILDSIFSSEADTEDEFAYVADDKIRSMRDMEVFRDVVENINRVLRLHTAVCYPVPNLMPKSPLYDCDSCFHVMDRGGNIISLPCDLRIPFAAHVAANGIKQLKRYTLEKVFKVKNSGGRPEEKYDYAFDIVTASPCFLLPDAEVIYIVSKIISKFSSLSTGNYFCCLNHSSLLEAIFLHCGVARSKVKSILKLLGKLKHRFTSRRKLQNQLLNLGIASKVVKKLMRFLNVLGRVDKVEAMLHVLTRSESEAGTLAKTGLCELRMVKTLLDDFGMKSPVYVSLDMVHEIDIFSGVIFEFSYCSKEKKKRLVDVISSGGRYDKLVSSFRPATSQTCDQFAVGASVAIEKIVAAELELKKTSQVVEYLIHSEDDELWSSVGKVLKLFWSRGIRATVIYDHKMSVEEAKNFCKDNSVKHLLVLKKGPPFRISITNCS